MEENNNERQLIKPAQQHMHVWGVEGVNENEFISPAVSTLALVGLGKAAASLETHPEHLTSALTSSDWAMRTAAVHALSKQGERAPLEALLRALQDEHAAVRAVAARTLGMQGKRMPVEPLVLTLHDPEWRVRAAAALALGQSPNSTLVTPLVSLVQDEQAMVRAAVVWALGRLGAQAPIEPLVMALRDPAWPVREAAVMALKAQGERAPIAPLLAARWDEDSSVRQAAETVLAHQFEEQPGQKLVPESDGQSPSSWLRLAVSMFSVLLLITLTAGLFAGSGFIGRFETISRLIALAVVCLAISVMNIFYQRKRSNVWVGQPRSHHGTGRLAHSWQGFALLVFSLSVLVGLTTQLWNSALPDQLGMTADIVHFILIGRLAALGCMALTVVVINRTFHLKR